MGGRTPSARCFEKLVRQREFRKLACMGLEAVQSYGAGFTFTFQILAQAFPGDPTKLHPCRVSMIQELLPVDKTRRVHWCAWCQQRLA